MKKKEQQIRTVYYENPLEDEFSSAKITPRKIDEKYKYERDRGFGKLICFLFYRVIAIPLSALYLKLKFRHEIVGRKKLKMHRGEGVFIYGNHTQPTADALIPTFISYPRWAYVIVHPANVSMPFLGRITPYMGAIPLPDELGAARNFTATVKKRIDGGKPVFIYPEAHIWPYYTGIRPFTDKSFVYPVRYGTPVYAFTNTYYKRKNQRKVRIVTYIDGPFYPDTALPLKERQAKLRDEVFLAMTARASLSDKALIEYKPKQKDEKND
jgi:1-acyl-sn-glycerol-3-phosphate acyltransferase